jgi:hypothetical protein
VIGRLSRQTIEERGWLDGEPVRYSFTALATRAIRPKNRRIDGP